MPTIQGINMCITTSVDEAGQPTNTKTKVSRFPEFPHTAPQPLQPEPSQHKTSRPLSSLFGGCSKAVEIKEDTPADPKRQSSVYIPLLPQAASFQISYAFIPEFPEGVRFAYVVLFNGKHVVTADVMPQKEPKGYLCQTIGETDDGVGSNKTFKYEALGFEFAAQKRLIKKSRVEDGGLIEVRWYRIYGSKPVELELAGKPPSQTLKDKYGICFKPTGPPPNLKHRVYLLKDAVEQPWAAFKFFYRSWKSLREHSIVVEDEYSENFRQEAAICDSTRSLLSNYEDEERLSSLSQAPATTMNSSHVKWTTISRSPNVANKYVPVGMALAAYFGGGATEANISRTVQGRIIAQSTADEDRRQPLMLEEAPRRSRSTTRREADTADRKSVASFTPSLRECVDREDATNGHDIVGVAKAFSVTDLAVPKVRRGHSSGAHTGISAQLAAMRAHDNCDTDSTVDPPADKENGNPVAGLCLPPHSTGIYQQDNTGLAHYGENGLSSQSMSYQDTSSVIDPDFAASELAPPTMGVRISNNSRRQSFERCTPGANTFRATLRSSPIQTPGGHDFHIISPSLTPKAVSTSTIIESSPTKTPGGGEFPVDPPGSVGFPVIEPGENLELSQSECSKGCVSGTSSDAGKGSVIHHIPPKVSPKSIGLPRNRKPLAPPFLSPVRGRGLNSQAPSSPYPSSSTLEDLVQLGLVGVVQCKISRYESPRDSLLVPSSRAVSPYVAEDMAGGEAAHARPGGGLGNLKASASLLALQDRQIGEAKSVIAAAKSKLGFHLKLERYDSATGGKVSGDIKMTVDDLNITFSADDTLESSSPAKLVRKSSLRSKSRGKENTSGDDVFCPAAGEVATPRSRPSSEDDPDHPLRRRASLSKTTCHDWMSPAHKRSKYTSTLSKGGEILRLGKLVPADRQDNEVAAIMSFSSKGQIIVGSAVVADGVLGSKVAENDADSHGNPSANDDSRAAPAPTNDVGFTATTGSSNDDGDACGESGRPASPLHDYARRMIGLIPPIKTLSGGVDHTTLEDHFFDDDALDVDLAVFDDMLRENARQRQTAERHGIFARANLIHVGELVRSAVGVDAAAASMSAELYNAYAMSPPVYRGAQANPIIGSEGQQDGEDGTVSTNLEQTYSQLHVQQMQQEIIDSLARASATFPVANKCGSVQAAQSSPVTPSRRPVSAATDFPPRNSSLRYASRPAATTGLNITPTRSTLNAVPIPSVGPPAPVGGLAAPVYRGPQGNALSHSPTVLQRPHPLGGTHVARSPSGHIRWPLL